MHWFATIEAARFRLLVRRLLQFITIREFPPANGFKLPPATKSRWWIPSATRILALLHAANFKVYPSIISYTEFYNSALDHINLMAEYHRWQSPPADIGSSRASGSRFSYCQYPFVLSIVAKKVILQKDSEHQMILNARVSLIFCVCLHCVPRTFPNDLLILSHFLAMPTLASIRSTHIRSSALNHRSRCARLPVHSLSRRRHSFSSAALNLCLALSSLPNPGILVVNLMGYAWQRAPTDNHDCCRVTLHSLLPFRLCRC